MSQKRGNNWGGEREGGGGGGVGEVEGAGEGGEGGSKISSNRAS